MNKMDYERAEAYEMPETEPDGFAEAYLHTPIKKIRTYSLAQFDHWTKEPFSSNFRNICKRVLAPHHGHKTQRFSSSTSFMLFIPSFCNQTQLWQ